MFRPGVFIGVMSVGLLVVFIIVSMSPSIQLFQNNPVGAATAYTQTLHYAQGEDDPISMFQHNTCSPECCPGEFSCSHGCVCTLAQMSMM